MLYCTECDQECRENYIDGGIGAYEFWGAKGYDSRPVIVSDCCEASIRDDEGRSWSLADAREEAEAAAADAYLDARDGYDCDDYF